MLVPEKTSGPSCITSRPSDSVRMIASLKSERLNAPNEGSKPEFHLRWIRELVTRISSALDFLTTSRLPVTNRDKSADSFRLADHSCRIVGTHRTRTIHLVGSGEHPIRSAVLIRIG